MYQTQSLRYEPIKAVNLNQNGEKAFPIDVLVQQNLCHMAMSDYSVMSLSIDTLQPVWRIPAAHRKRITQICQVDPKLIATSSSDASINIYDITSGTKVGTLKNQNFDDFYSVACSQHILAAGSEGAIRFFDMRTSKIRSSFDESQNDEITSVRFNPEVSTELLASSLDGLLVQYDLTQENEEESLSNMIRFDDPLNFCEYFNDKLCYSISTTFTLTVVDLKKGEKIKDIKTVQHDEFNEDYLVDVCKYRNQLNYFLGHKEDNTKHIRQYELNLNQTNILQTAQKQQIRHIKYLEQHDTFLLFGEDGVMEILQPKQVKVNSIMDEANQMFI